MSEKLKQSYTPVEIDIKSPGNFGFISKEKARNNRIEAEKWMADKAVKKEDSMFHKGINERYNMLDMPEEEKLLTETTEAKVQSVAEQDEVINSPLSNEIIESGASVDVEIENTTDDQELISELVDDKKHLEALVQKARNLANLRSKIKSNPDPSKKEQDELRAAGDIFTNLYYAYEGSHFDNSVDMKALELIQNIAYPLSAIEYSEPLAGASNTPKEEKLLTEMTEVEAAIEPKSLVEIGPDIKNKDDIKRKELISNVAYFAKEMEKEAKIAKTRLSPEENAQYFEDLNYGARKIATLRSEIGDGSNLELNKELDYAEKCFQSLYDHYEEKYAKNTIDETAVSSILDIAYSSNKTEANDPDVREPIVEKITNEKDKRISKGKKMSDDSHQMSSPMPLEDSGQHDEKIKDSESVLDDEREEIESKINKVAALRTLRGLASEVRESRNSIFVDQSKMDNFNSEFNKIDDLVNRAPEEKGMPDHDFEIMKKALAQIKSEANAKSDESDPSETDGVDFAVKLKSEIKELISHIKYKPEAGSAGSNRDESFDMFFKELENDSDRDFPENLDHIKESSFVEALKEDAKERYSKAVSSINQKLNGDNLIMPGRHIFGDGRKESYGGYYNRLRELGTSRLMSAMAIAQSFSLREPKSHTGTIN